MIAASQPKAPLLLESKIIHRSPVLHPLARFVSEETVALMFNITPEQIYRIECCRHMVYVHAKGVSRFVSYADFPPRLEVNPPTAKEILRWHKRWRDRWQSKQAPEFWQQFYTHQFKNVNSIEHLREWGLLVAQIKSEFTLDTLQKLREIYAHEQYWWQHF